METMLEKADRIVIDFLKRILQVEDEKIKITKTVKKDGGWSTEAEVFEESGFIKSLGLPTRVRDRNLYSITLDDNMDVVSYERVHGEGPTE